MVAMRPTREDRDALRLLLAREDLGDYDAEFVDSIRNFDRWSEKQAAYFDRVWEKYYG